MPQKEAVIELGRLQKDADVDQDTALIVSLRLRKPGKAEEMIAWMQQNKTATPEEIDRKSEDIARSQPAKIHIPTPAMLKAREE